MGLAANVLSQHQPELQYRLHGSTHMTLPMSNKISCCYDLCRYESDITLLCMCYSQKVKTIHWPKITLLRNAGQWYSCITADHNTLGS